MKRLSILFLQCVFLTVVSAQSALSVFPSTAVVSNPPASVDNPAKAHLVNISNAQITVQWQRFGVVVPNGIYTQVCDPNSCWPAAVNAFSFDLPAGDTANMDMHFVNETGLTVPPFAEAHIKMWVDGNPADSVIVLYRYTTQTVGTQRVLLSEAVAYPNPGTDVLLLKNAGTAAFVAVYSLDGRFIKRMASTPEHRYPMHDLPVGQYQILLEQEKGKILQQIIWNKS